MSSVPNYVIEIRGHSSSDSAARAGIQDLWLAVVSVMVTDPNGQTRPEVVEALSHHSKAVLEAILVERGYKQPEQE